MIERHVPKAALVAFVAYLGGAAALGGHLPLLHFTMFKFSVPRDATVVPFFRAGGELTAITGYGSFDGLPPHAVDVEHRGFECSVEHMLHEQRDWLAAHQRAPGDAAAGAVPAEIGIHILEIGSDRRVQRVDRVVAAGTARPLP